MQMLRTERRRVQLSPDPRLGGDAVHYLRQLVTALDKAFISSWQTTADWQHQLDAARDFLEKRT